VSDHAKRFYKTGLDGRKSPLPFPTVLFEELFPSMKCGDADVKDFADLFRGHAVQEMFCKHPENKEEAVLFIRDDRIEQDGVSCLAGLAEDAQHSDLRYNGMSVHKVDEIPFVVGKDTAPSLGFTIRAGFRFRPKGNHVLVKEYLSGFNHADKVAIDQVLSYHDIDVPDTIAIS